MSRQEWIDRFVAELMKWLGGERHELQAVAELRVNDGLRSSLTPEHQVFNYKMRREQWVAELAAEKNHHRLKASGSARAFADEWTAAFRVLLKAAPKATPLPEAEFTEQAFTACGATMTPTRAFHSWSGNPADDDEAP